MKESQEQYIVDDQGNNTAVIIPIKAYEELLEDIDDFVIISCQKVCHGIVASADDEVKLSPALGTKARFHIY